LVILESTAANYPNFLKNPPKKKFRKFWKFDNFRVFVHRRGDLPGFAKVDIFQILHFYNKKLEYKKRGKGGANLVGLKYLSRRQYSNGLYLNGREALLEFLTQNPNRSENDIFYAHLSDFHNIEKVPKSFEILRKKKSKI